MSIDKRKREVVSTYSFEEDALGLGQFINDQMDALEDDVSPVVYVEDGRGSSAIRADWIIRTLTDGSRVAELRIHFD